MEDIGISKDYVTTVKPHLCEEVLSTIPQDSSTLGVQDTGVEYNEYPDDIEELTNASKEGLIDKTNASEQELFDINSQHEVGSGEEEPNTLSYCHPTNEPTIAKVAISAWKIRDTEQGSDCTESQSTKISILRRDLGSPTQNNIS